VDWVPGEHIRLAANSAYWGTGPQLDHLVFQVIDDEPERFSALQSNAVQGAGDLSPSHVSSAALDANLKVLWRAPTDVGYVGINRIHAPLGNLLVRRAIAHAIDKRAILQEHYNLEAEIGQVATQLLPPVMWGHDPDLVDYAYDPALARTLLAQAGLGGGFTTTLLLLPFERGYFPSPSDIAETIQADLQSVGITATLVSHDWPTYHQIVSGGEADLFMSGWMPDYGHPYSYFGPILCSGQALGPQDDVLCGQVWASLAEHDFDALLAIYQGASQRVHATMPLLPIARSRDAVVVRSNVAGAVPAPLYAASLKDLHFTTWEVYLPIVIRSAG
jgi:ABC-type transport system substrate-binding protein